MKGLKWALSGLAAVMVALLALPALAPLDGYRDELSRTASERLEEPVTIGKLRVSLLPSPRLTASDVSVGEKEVLALGTVVIRPRLASLLRDEKVIRAVEISDVAATQSALQRLALLAARGTRNSGAVQVENIVLRNALVKTPRGEIGPLHAEIAFTPSGEPGRATLRTADDKLRAELVPERANYAVSVHAEGWKLPWGPGLVFEKLSMTGRAGANEAHFQDVVAQVYGGTAQGALRLGWKDDIRLSGNFTLEHVELADLLEAFAAKSRVTGRLNAKPAFSTRASEAADLGRALRLEGPFQLSSAVLHGVDLRAAASLVKSGERSSDTRFDELSGELLFERGVYRFSRLKASSGALAARGDLTLSAKKDLSGRVYAQVQPMGGAADVPLNVSGTLDAPVIAPTGASIAGAAVGTAVLGPVLGTSIGAKLGDITEGLLGGNDKRRQ